MSDTQQTYITKDRLSHEAQTSNKAKLTSARSITSIAAGAAAGILRLQGLVGFVFYVISMVALSASMRYMVNARGVKVVPDDSWLNVGMMSSIASYVLVWTIVFDLIHVY